MHIRQFLPRALLILLLRDMIAIKTAVEYWSKLVKKIQFMIRNCALFIVTRNRPMLFTH